MIKFKRRMAGKRRTAGIEPQQLSFSLDWLEARLFFSHFQASSKLPKFLYSSLSPRPFSSLSPSAIRENRTDSELTRKMFAIGRVSASGGGKEDEEWEEK